MPNEEPIQRRKPVKGSLEFWRLKFDFKVFSGVCLLVEQDEQISLYEGGQLSQK